MIPLLLASLILTPKQEAKAAPQPHLNLQSSFDPLKETPAEKAKRMHWWEIARFGMFIHWGLYSIPAGTWNGKEDGGAGEWIMNGLKIKAADYEKLQQQFNPVNFDADKWVKIAKDAGMKYIVITSKHHEGFDMFPSKYGTYNIGHTQFHRDPLKELAIACKKGGIKLCFYHSIMDWHEVDYLPRRPWDPRPGEPADYDKYVAYMKAQLKELLTNYGPIGLLWFDGEWEDTWTHDRGVDLYEYVRRLQPNIIVNNRVDTGRAGIASVAVKGNVGDYGTPEQTIPANGLPGTYWETCMTMNDTWGFRLHDNNWKSSTTLLHNLIDIASKGGNYLLNVGPTSLGEIPEPSVERLAVMGKWMHTNGEAIYGTSASPFAKPLPWGRVTQKPGKLYLSVFDTNATSVLLPGLMNSVTKAYLLADGHKKPLEVVKAGDGVHIALPLKMPDKVATVVVAEIKGKPEVAPPPPVSDHAGVLVLDGQDAQLYGQLQYEAANRAIGYWTSASDSVNWTFSLTQPGTYNVTVDYACEPSSAGGTFAVKVGGSSVEGTTNSTKDWHTFTTENIGTIKVSAAGKYTLSVKPTKISYALMNLRSVTLKRQ